MNQRPRILDYSLSYEVASGSEIMPCNKIDKPLVVYRSSGNVMMSITMLFLKFVCLPNLKFSDPLPETHLFICFIWP